MAMELISVLDDIYSGYFPEYFSDQDDERLDSDDLDQYGRLIIGLRRLLNRGSIGRVIMGMAVVCDPSNECIDPDASTIEHHPKRQQLEKQVEGLLLAETNLRQQIAHLNDQLAGEKSNVEQANRQLDELLKALIEIKSGHCPSQYPMTLRGLIDYHFAISKAAIASVRKSQEKCYYATDGTLMNPGGA